MPQDSSALLSRAIRAHRKGDLAQALEKYEQRLEQEPLCLDACVNLGALQAQLGRAREAREAFRRAAQLAPGDGRVLRDIGVGLRTIGRLQDAAAALERSVECSPELVGSWLHLARTRLEVGARASAVSAAQCAVDLRPEDPSSWFVLARCLFDPQAPAPALHALERAQQCASGYPEAHIFHSLIAGHHAATASGDGVALKYAKQLTDHAAIHPQLRDFADAASHVLCELGGSRLFSSARDTLLYAASQASAAGSCVELGVFHGVSLGWLVACRSWQVHGFDSFAGLPSDWEGVPQGTFTTAGRVPEGLDAQFWVGAFEEQLPEYVAKHTEPIALLHIDSDLYESARSGLAHLGPLLRAGSVLVFDEYLGHRNWRQGEYRAFQEVVEHYGWHCEPLAVNPFTGQAVFRLAP